MSDQLPCPECGHYAVACDDAYASLKEDLRVVTEELAEARREAEALRADAERHRYTRSKVSRIFNEETLMMDGLRVEAYYETPQPFVLREVDTSELWDAAIDAARSAKP